MEIVWSRRASNEIEAITTYWTNTNFSNTYSIKVLEESDRVLQLILTNPELGIRTNKLGVRMRLVLECFYIFYKFEEENLIVLKFWDTRQDPKSNDFF